MLTSDREPLRIGLVASPVTMSRFRRMCPQVIWYHYASLAVCFRGSEPDGIEVLVVEAMQVERSGDIWWESLGGLRVPVASKPLESLCDQYPILVLLARESVLCEWMAIQGGTVLREPVDTSGLMEACATHQEAIQAKRLKRLFQQVADTFGRKRTP
jgi:hypothetical protein